LVIHIPFVFLGAPKVGTSRLNIFNIPIKYLMVQTGVQASHGGEAFAMLRGACPYRMKEPVRRG
jgi:hypothetical protein